MINATMIARGIVRVKIVDFVATIPLNDQTGRMERQLNEEVRKLMMI